LEKYRGKVDEIAGVFELEDAHDISALSEAQQGALLMSGAAAAQRETEAQILLAQQREQLEVAVGHMRRVIEEQNRVREEAHERTISQIMMVDDERVRNLMWRLFVLLKEVEAERRVKGTMDIPESLGRAWKGRLLLKCDRDPVSASGDWNDEECRWEMSADGVNPMAAYLAACFYLDCCDGLSKESSEQLAEFLNNTRSMFPHFPSYTLPPGVQDQRPTGWRRSATLMGVGSKEVFGTVYNGWLRRRIFKRAPDVTEMPMISGLSTSWTETHNRPANQVLYALSRYFKVVRVRGRQGGALDWAWWGGRRRGGGDGQHLKEMAARHKMEKEMLMEDNTRLGERGDAMQRRMMAQRQQMMAQQQQMMMMRRQMMAMEQRMAMMQRGRG